MTLKLQITPELSARIAEASHTRGVEPEQYVREVLQEAVAAKDRISEAVRSASLLRSLSDHGTPEEQAETMAFLKDSLNADATSARLRFP